MADKKITNAKIGTAELAYLGDAVFELMVRDMLIAQGVAFKDISPSAVKYVSATAQSEMYHKIFEKLTEKEQYIMKRGRNLHSASRAKSAKVAQYRHATGIEALFGHLHIEKQLNRLAEVFNLCIGENICNM